MCSQLCCLRSGHFLLARVFARAESRHLRKQPKELFSYQAMGKRKTQPPSSDDDDFEDVEEEEGEKPKKKKSAPKETPAKRPAKIKKDAPKEPFENLGWTVHPPSLIYREWNPEPGDRIAAFDLDGTLAVQRTTMRMPRDEDDWVLYNKKVPKVLQDYADDGYKIVVFSNQGGIKSALTGKMAEKVLKRTKNIMEKIDVPATVYLATSNDDFRKSNTGMWDFFIKHHNSGVKPDLSQSFFVGDAAGRVGDFADTDKGFAANVGLSFKVPEEVFGEPDKKKFAPTPSTSSGVNDDIAEAFRAAAAREENPFGQRAISKAADIIAGHPTRIVSGAEMGKLQGIGKGSVAKINEFLATGKIGGVAVKAADEGGLSSASPAGAASEDASMALKFA